MGTFKDESKNYKPQELKNICDLEIINIEELALFEEEKIDNEGKTYKYKYFLQNGIKYRTPYKVLEEVQKMLKLKPDLKTIRVTKTGEGKKTKYNVEAII